MNNGTDTKYFKENRLQGARTCSKGNARRLQVQVPSEEDGCQRRYR